MLRNYFWNCKELIMMWIIPLYCSFWSLHCTGKLPLKNIFNQVPLCASQKMSMCKIFQTNFGWWGPCLFQRGQLLPSLRYLLPSGKSDLGCQILFFQRNQLSVLFRKCEISWNFFLKLAMSSTESLPTKWCTLRIQNKIKYKMNDIQRK